MKNILLILLGVFTALPTLARDFEYLYEGQFLIYTVLDEDAKTCEVKAGIFTDYYESPGFPVYGDLVIPEIAKDEDVEYTVISIGDYAFLHCSEMTSVEIANTITTIGKFAFSDCSSLTWIVIPNSVTSLGEDPFAGCKSLTEIDVDNKNINYTAIGGILFNRDMSELIRYPEGLKGSYTIPNSVVFIGNKAFSGCSNLISINIPTSVTSIGMSAFYGCSGLTSVIIPNSVTSIGMSAFGSCINLKRITLSNKLEYIPMSCFCYCYALEEADIPESVRFIDMGAFDTAKSLKRLHLPANVELHPFGAFDGLSSCVSITVDERNPYYVAEDNMLFSKDMKSLILIAGSKKGKIIIPESVENLPSRMFYFMPYITDIQLPLTYTGNIPYMFVFECPMIKHVSLPDVSKNTNSVTVAHCESLESLTIGRNLEFGTGVYHNPALKHIFLRNNSKLDLLQVFNYGSYKNMNFYTDRTEPNAILDQCETFYVPGACKEKFEGIADCIISEMWKYQIDRESGLIAIIPTIDCITIDKVCINGTESQAKDGYLYIINNSESLDVTIDFTLMERQAMTTHYTPEFNAVLESGIEDVIVDRTGEDVIYNLQGIRVQAPLTPGFYIINGEKRLVK